MVQHQFRVLAETGVGSPGLPLYTREQLKQSPSVQQGMDPDTERRNRLQYAAFITELGMSLQVPQWCIYTGVFLCHHYYAKRSFQLSDKYLVAVASFYLGCKVQENPKYLRDVIKHAEMIKWARYAKEHPLETRKWEDMAHLEAVRDEVLVAERALLYTLSFQLRIVTPYQTLLALQASPDVPAQHKHNLVNVSWSMLNDSLKTIVSLMYPPEQLAAAAIYFGYVALGLQPPPDKDGRSFCEYTRTPADALQEILDIMLSVYNTAVLPKGSIPATPLQSQEQDAAAVKQPSPPSGGAEPLLQLRGDRVVAVTGQAQAQAQQQQQQQQPQAGQPLPPKPEPGAVAPSGIGAGSQGELPAQVQQQHAAKLEQPAAQPGPDS